MTPLCTLKNLSLSFPNKTLFKEVQFTLNEGDKIGVLGLNGHGKSSLFKVLAQELTPDTSTPPFIYDKSRDFSLFLVPQELPLIKNVTIEDYFYEFYPAMKAPKLRLDKLAELLADENADFDKLIDEQTKLYDKLQSLGEDWIYPKYISYLKHFGLPDHDQLFEKCSGGEQRKIALSLGLSAPHKVILWDEPTNHLDLETIELFEDELGQAQNTFLVISHDRSLLNNIVDRIVHIQSGKIQSFKGTYESYLQFLKDEEARREKELDRLSNTHRRETAWLRQGVQARRTRSKKRLEGYGDLSNKIKDLKAQAHKKAEINMKASGRKTKVLASAEDLSLSFGDNLLFDKLNFNIAKGDKISLLGRNGVGKSSLLKILMGEISPSNGSMKTAEGLKVGYFSQKRDSLDDNSTPWELIGEGVDFIVSNNGDRRHVASYLESFLFQSEELKRPIHTFSGGEKNRLQLAKFMKDACDIWIFDEPTNDLDLETIGVLEEELKSYKGAVIIIAHDRTFIDNVTDKTWLLYDKKLEFFEGGYPQAKLYIEALQLEESLKEKTPELSAPAKSENKPTNKEKQRFKVIEKEIETQESLVTKLEKEFEGFDYTSMDDKKRTSLGKLEAKIKAEKEKLERIMNEWATLEERLS